MNYKTVYVINYKETTNENLVETVECGTCEVGFTDEKDAIQKMYEITDGVINEHLEEVDDGLCYRESNDNGDWQMVKVNDDMYEYWIVGVDVEV